jgi:hypothetical protein
MTEEQLRALGAVSVRPRHHRGLFWKHFCKT